MNVVKPLTAYSAKSNQGGPVNEKDAIELKTNLAAGRILSIGAQRISSSLDAFSGWLLAGFGAVFGLLITNFGTLRNYINPQDLKFSAGLFLIAVTFAALEKILASFVLAGTASSEEGRNFGREIASEKIPLDVESMYRQVRAGLFWPLSALYARMTAKAKLGDYAVIGRQHAKTSQVQLLFLVFQCIFSIASAAYVLRGMAI